MYSEWNCPVACYHDDTSDYSSQTSDVWSISSTFVNEARFSFNRQGSFLTPFSLGLGIPSKIGMQYAKADVCKGAHGPEHAYKMDAKGKCRDEKGRFAKGELCRH